MSSTNKYAGLDKSFIMHMFMDGNVSPYAGSNSLIALQNFSKLMLSNKEFRNIEEQNLINEARNTIMNITSDASCIKYENIDNLEEFQHFDDTLLRNIINVDEYNALLTRANEHIIEYKKRRKTNNDKMKNDDASICDIVGIVSCSKSIFENVSKNMSLIMKNNRFFFPIRVIDKENDIGHAMGVYFVKTEDNYDIAIVNSGYGISNYHPYLGDSIRKYQNVVLLKNISIEICTRIMMLCVSGHYHSILKNYASSDYNNPFVVNFYNIVKKYYIDVITCDFFYETIMKLVNVVVFDESFANKGYYYGEQMSGSCTFYSILYFLKYFNYAKNTLGDFDKRYEKLKSDARINILKGFLESKIGSKTIDDSDIDIANVLLLFGDNKENETYRQNIYDIYKRTTTEPFITLDNFSGTLFYKNKIMKHNNTFINIDHIYGDIDGSNDVLNYVINLCRLIQCMLSNLANIALSGEENQELYLFAISIFVEKIIKNIINRNRTTDEDFFKVNDIEVFLIYCNIFVSNFYNLLQFESNDNKKDLIPLFLFANIIARVMSNPEVVKVTKFIPSANKMMPCLDGIYLSELLINNETDFGEISKYYEYFTIDKSDSVDNNIKKIYDKWKSVEKFNVYLYPLINFKVIQKSAFYGMIYDTNDDYRKHYEMSSEFEVYENHEIIVSELEPVFFEKSDMSEFVNIDYNGFFKYESFGNECNGTFALLPGKYIITCDSCKIVKCSEYIKNMILDYKDGKICYYNNMRLLNAKAHGEHIYSIISDIDYHGHLNKNMGANGVEYCKEMYDVKDIENNKCNISVTNSKIIIENISDDTSNLSFILNKYEKKIDKFLIMPNKKRNAVIHESNSESSYSHTMLYNFYADINDASILKMSCDKVENILNSLQMELSLKLIDECLFAKCIFNPNSKLDDSVLSVLKKFIEKCIVFYNENQKFSEEYTVEKITIFKVLLFIIEYNNIEYNNIENNNTDIIDIDNNIQLLNTYISKYIHKNISSNSFFDSYNKYINMLVKMFIITSNNDVFNKLMNDSAFSMYNHLKNKYPSCVVEQDNNTLTYNVRGVSDKKNINLNFVNNSIINLPCFIRDRYVYEVDKSKHIYPIQYNAYDSYSSNAIVIEDYYSNNTVSNIYKIHDNIKYKYIDSEKYNSSTKKDTVLLKFVNLFETITDKIVLWTNDNYDNFLVEFPTIHDNIGNYLMFKIYNSKVYYGDYVLDTDLFLHKRFVSGIKNAFVISKDMTYKILLVNENVEVLSEKLREMMENSSYLQSRVNHVDVEKIMNNNMIDNMYYVIDIHMTGMFLSFPCEGAYFSYFMYANICQKTDIIVMLYSLSPMYNNNKSIQTLLYYPNTPYNCYIHFIYRQLCGGITLIEKIYSGTSIIKLMMDRINYYPSKYRIDVEKKAIEKNEKNDKPNTIYTHNLIDNLYENNHIHHDNDAINGDMLNKNADMFKSDNVIGSSIINSINLFMKKSYGKDVFINCKLNEKQICEDQDNILGYVNMNYNNIAKSMREKHEYVSNLVFSSHDYNYIDLIINDSNIFYELLTLNKSMELLLSVKKIICKNDNGELNENYCNQVLFLTNMLDEYYVYKGNRQKSTIIFEIMFGSLIRKQQYNIFNEIVNEIDNKKDGYDIRQMLMGKGKTAVITPMLLFKYVYEHDHIKNIVIVLPSHLMNQTYNMIVNKYSHAMTNVSIKKIHISRYDDNDVIASYFKNKIDEMGRIRKNVIVTNISSMQSIILRNSEDKKNVIPFKKEETLFIFDEIDSLSDPLSNELNHPKINKNSDMYKDISVDIVVDFVMKMFPDDETYVIGLDKNKIANDDMCKQYVKNIVNGIRGDIEKKIDTKYGEGLNKTKVNFLFKTIGKILVTVLQDIHNKNYGFDTTNESSYVAIPYNGVKSPVSGSEFSDMYIKMAFTCMSYMYEKELRSCDISNIKSYIKQLYNESSYDKSSHSESSDHNISKKYFSNNEIVKASKIDVGKINNETDIDNICIKKNKTLISAYLKHIVLKKYISQYEKQYNCSFIDVVSNDFSQYKIGFSGTVGDIHIDVLKTTNDGTQYMFNRIDDDAITMGSIYSAFLGTTQKNEDDKPKIIKLKDDKIGDIINEIVVGEYDCLIDTGAILRNYTSKEVIDKIIDEINDFKVYVYINESGKEKRIINHDKNAKRSMFIYYDQIHTVGHDIPDQPYSMKGIVTVNYFNRFTDISQGMFRLRKLNYGHKIDFATINVNCENNRNSLLLHLMHEDEKYKNSTLSLASLQQLKYLKRKNIQDDRYIENVFYEIDHIIDNDKDIYRNYIDNNFCISSKDKNIENLCSDAKNAKINKKNKQEQTQEQKQKAIQKNEQKTTSLERKVVTSVDGKKITRKYQSMTIDELLNYDKIKNMLNLNNEAQEFRIIDNILSTNSVYLHYSVFTEQYDMLGNYNDVVANNAFSMYNFYIVQVWNDSNDDSVMYIIKPTQCIPIIKYLEENKQNAKIFIYTKNKLVYRSDPDFEKYDKKISLAKYLIGSPDIVDLLIAIKCIVEKSTEMNMDYFDKLQNILNLTISTTAIDKTFMEIVKDYLKKGQVHKNFDEYVKKMMDDSNIHNTMSLLNKDNQDVNIVKEVIKNIVTVYENISNYKMTGGVHKLAELYSKYLLHRSEYINYK